MTLQLIEDAEGDIRNAEYLSVASELAYLNAEEGAAAFKERLGLEGTLHSVGNTQAWVLHDDANIVVAFRGTESPTSLEGIKDWLLTDAMNLLILPEGRLGLDLAAAGVGARFHQGFVNALADIWPEVLSATKAALESRDRPLWLTGHSLGGALAVLAGWMFLRNTINICQIYTFGGPMVGNEEASRALDAKFDGRLYRYVNLLDPVPYLPTVSLATSSYAHCEREVSPKEGASEETSALALVRSFAGKAVEGVLSGRLLSDFWEAVTSRVSAHGMDAYRAMLQKLRE
jgi:hypothetical protein